MSRDKKSDDAAQSPADWVTRHSRFRVSRPTGPPQQRPHDESQIRRRSERETFLPSQHVQAAPLIDRIDNAWRDSKQVPYHDEYDPIARLCDPDDEGSCVNVTSRMAKSRRYRRLFFALLILLGVFSYYWIYYIWPKVEYDFDLKFGFLKHPRGTFGLAMGGDYEFAKEKIAQLDTSFLPGAAGDQHGKRRLVFVGDIHGCKDELLKLLRKIDFNETRDHLIATGDVVSKGPNNAGVVDELIRLNASCVRGNHEDRLLTLAAVQVDKFGHPEQPSKTAKKTTALLKELKPRHLEYLRNLPLILRIPPLPLATSSKALRSEVLVVHAGLVPAVPLDKQDPYFVMNMRSLRGTSHVPSDKPADKESHLLPWVDSWNWYNARLAKGRVFSGWHHVEQDLVDEQLSWIDSIVGLLSKRRRKGKPRPQVVVYGHDSRAGLVRKKWSRGLDTACVRGGQLTCLILDASGHETIESVECQQHAE